MLAGLLKVAVLLPHMTVVGLAPGGGEPALVADQAPLLVEGLEVVSHVGEVVAAVLTVLATVDTLAWVTRLEVIQSETQVGKFQVTF